MGNSQQFTCSLPKGVRADTTHEAPVMNDILASKLVEKAAHPITVYNASAPNQTMVEELWQGIYWFKVGTPRPKILLIASNFDTYRKTGIRNGFQTLLDDRAFVSALDRFPFADRPYGSEFASARRTFESRKEEGVTQQATGWTFEGWIRDRLDDSVPLYHARQQRKGNFLSVLYLLRVHMLQLRPTTKRHITGQPLAENLSALTDLVRLARASGAVTFIYNAPTNPAVSMFYEEEYRTYLDRLRALAKDESSYFADFSDAVPRDDWGYWIDGPDPIHFDERGHHTMAGRIDAAFGSQMAEVAAQ